MDKQKIEKLINYFEQQLRLQRSSEIKYTGEEAYFDAVDVCKNALKSDISQPKETKGVEELREEFIGFMRQDKAIVYNDIFDFFLPRLQTKSKE